MLTPTKQRVLRFINSYTAKNGFAPTLAEIRDGLKLNSISTIHQHIQELERTGHLLKKSKLHRSIEVPRDEMIRVSLLGTIAAGEPIEAIEEKETLAVPKSRIGNLREVYALRVRGDSMIDEGVNDGDTILVKRQTTAENGQKVVALLDNFEATLKTFYKDKTHIRLQPANKKYDPIIVKNKRDITIQGVLFDVIKSGELDESFSPVTTTPEERGIKKTLPYFEEPDFTLYHGNSIDILQQLPENSIDMIFADPPYNLSNGGFSVHAGKMVSVNKGDWDRSKGFKDDYEFHYKWLEACRRVLKPEGTIWLSGTYHSIYQCGHALQSLNFHILNDIAWFKPNASPNLSCRFFTASHETLIWARKDKKAKHHFDYQLMKNGEWAEDAIKKPGLQMRSVWSIHPPQKWEKTFGKHPTQKPVALLKRAILSSTKPGATILDPFTGSSTTGIASKMIGKRKFIGIDMEKNYLDLSIKRWREAKIKF